MALMLYFLIIHPSPVTGAPPALTVSPPSVHILRSVEISIILAISIVAEWGIVILRFYEKILRKSKLGIDDFFMVMALLLCTPAAILILYGMWDINN